MSDLGLLSHVYADWNDRLASFNEWLLLVRKALGGYVEEADLTLPEDVRELLEDVRDAFRVHAAGAAHVGSRLPSTLWERLLTRLDVSTEEAEEGVSRILDAPDLRVEEVREEDVQALRTILLSLSDEVAALYDRVYRHL